MNAQDHAMRETSAEHEILEQPSPSHRDPEIELKRTNTTDDNELDLTNDVTIAREAAYERQNSPRVWTEKTEKRVGLLRRADIDHIDYPQWVVEGVLPAEAVSMVYGHSGTGKSFWALDMALCIATGRKWNERAVRPGVVIYVAGEGTSGYKARLEAWEQKHGVRAEEFSLRPEPVRLWHNPESVQRFLNDVTGANVRPVLVVLDTLGTCLGGANENDNGQMRELLDSAEAISRVWGAAVLLVHHTPKVGEGARGAQALQDGVAMHARLQGDGKTYGTLTCTKQKDAAPFAPIRRTLHKVSLENGAEALTFAEEYKTGPRDSTKRRMPWPHIRALLQRSPSPMTPRMVAEALQMRREAAYQQLTRAEKRGEVSQMEGSAAYALAPT
jgi:AAA domain-containing protein